MDCSLAELYFRGQATQEALASVQQHEAMAVLLSRLDQLEDSMGSVQQAAVHAAEMQAAQQSLKATDTAYIRWVGGVWAAAGMRRRGGHCRVTRLAGATCLKPALGD